MTVTDASTAHTEMPPPPPPPATITFEGKHGKNPLAEAGFGAMCRRLPAVLGHTARMAWAVDQPAVVLLLVCQLLTGATAATVLAFTARAMTHLLGTGTVSERLHGALPALVLAFASIHAQRGGIFTRGVLLDVARARGVRWVEPADMVTVEDLEAAEEWAGVRA